MAAAHKQWGWEAAREESEGRQSTRVKGPRKSIESSGAQNAGEITEVQGNNFTRSANASQKELVSLLQRLHEMNL